MTDQTARGPHARPADSYSAEEMASLLTEGARLAGTHSAAAAMHLLTYTELPGRRDFANHVEAGLVYDQRAGHDVLAAWVKDWDALLGGRLSLTGSSRRMLEIAASYATGRPVDLSENGNGLGTAHARRLTEAVTIGAGMAEFYTISGTDRLAQMHAHLPLPAAPS